MLKLLIVIVAIGYATSWAQYDDSGEPGKLPVFYMTIQKKDYSRRVEGTFR